MHKLITALLATGLFAVAGCSQSVDRPGTRDRFVEDIENFGGTADGDCVDDVFERYSDDELKNLVDDPEDPRSVELATELIACTDLED